MKKYQILTLIILGLCCFVIFPLTNAEMITLDSQTSIGGTVDSMYNSHPSATSVESAWAVSFTPVQDSYVTSVSIDRLGRIGSITGTLQAALYASTGTVGTNATPTGAALELSDSVNIATLGATYKALTFTFSGTTLVEQGTHYFVAIQLTEAGGDGSNYVRLTMGNLDASKNSASYKNSQWGYYTQDLTFIIYGDTVTDVTPTPTATPPGYTPTPGPNDISDVIDAIMSNINVLIYLAVIFIFGVLGYGFAGAWGFFAGVNLAVIMLVLFGTLDLWVAVAMIVLDGLMFFGKAEIGKGNKKED